MAPDFYREDRPYLKTLCRRLQAFCESDRKVLVVNMPPRHGKSRTAVLLSQWLFGRDPSEQIMTGSYNETLSTTFARAVRDGIAEERFDPSRIVFSDIFPQTRIKYGEAAAGKWALEGQYASYLATSPGGTATGFGARKLILDDLIKKAEEAFNEGALDKAVVHGHDAVPNRNRLQDRYHHDALGDRRPRRPCAGALAGCGAHHDESLAGRRHDAVRRGSHP